ncbi:MAG TPA: UDP-N-acetylmuramyl-tripeptide synthetase [Candidatus Magasanikbacteria bacterium]|mgnify:CR=1 FL=1|nr:UDP-N-acetylmuramyl-tripeptide synthetase [Candidatus Magasanikbacteria bacterium]
MKMKKGLRKIFPRWVFDLRHFFIASRAARQYRHPSRELFVIGVTGTSGKSTTVDFIRQMLIQAGFRAGSLSTVDFHIGGMAEINSYKMTMIGGDFIQRKLREMVEAGVEVAVVETSSEGILQYRHRFVEYDMVILTNLYPEHIEAHGGFANYKKAKMKLFAHTAGLFRKPTTGKLQRFVSLFGERIDKIGIVGASDHAADFLQYDLDLKKIFGEKNNLADIKNTDEQIIYSDVSVTATGLDFSLNGEKCHASLLGEHNVHNITAAALALSSLRVPMEKIRNYISHLHGVPGRLEKISEADVHGFQVIVDYAFEPIAVAALYRSISTVPHQRIIHVCGSTGGGRDVARREPLGRLIGDMADVVFVTNEDPYDDDPQLIIDDVARGVLKSGKQINKDVFKITDRREAIEKALKMAEPNDLVLITGKGSEQGMCIEGGKIVPWDDRMAVREILESI